MNLKKYISILIFVFSSIAFAQEASFTASVSKNKLGVNQRFRVNFTVNKQGADNFKTPAFKNFKIISGPSQSVSQSQSWINGKVTKEFSQTYTFILQPKKVGVFNFPVASITIDGKTVTTKPLKITVTEAVEIPKNPNDPNYIANKNIHLVAELSKSNPYVGEGVYVEYRLYFSDNVGIYQNSITEAPKYDGFWNQEIKQNGLPVKRGTYKGEAYRYAVLHKALLIPTKSGKLTVDPMKMDIAVQVPTGKVDFFGNHITRNVREEFASFKKVVNVKALPLENQPENFNGAVGNFKFNALLSKDGLKANESSQLKLKVTGKGNLKLFELPKLKTPEELEVYPPEHKEKVSTTSTGLSGVVYDLYTIVPQYKGKYKIPNVSFSYFNPKDEQYHTINSNDIYVNVLEGKELVTKEEDNTVAKQDVKITGNDFRFIQTKTNLKETSTSSFFNSIWFYVLLLLPLLAVPIVIFIKNKQAEKEKDILGNKVRKADKLAKKYLFEAKNNLGKKDTFYESLERALHNYLKAKLGVETSDISKEKITTLLERKNISKAVISDFIAVLKDCDFARYTPTTNVQMKQEYDKAIRVITKLDKQL